MLKLYFLIAIVTILACFAGYKQKLLSTQNIIETQKRDFSVLLSVFFITIIFILFSGLRTRYNDTETYMHAYTLLNTNLQWSELFESYGGFDIYQKLIKIFITNNPQMLIFISAIITNLLYLHFYKKYSVSFGYTVFLYVVVGLFTFSMAGIKQIIAMSFSLLAIDNLLSKKYFKFALWIMIASTFHPYILIMFLILLFVNDIWSRKSIILIVIVLIFSLFFEPILNIIINVAGEIGKEYTVEELTSNTINIYRVAIEIIPCVLTYIFRNKIRNENSKLLNLAVNMLLFRTLMYIVSMFANPIYFARIGTYFQSLDPILIAWLLTYCLPKDKNGTLFRIAYCTLYFIYFTLDMTKLNFAYFSYDFFAHTSLANIF